MKRAVYVLLSLALVVCGCKKPKQPDTPTPDPEETGGKKVTGITISQNSLNLSIGKTYQLEASVVPSTAENQRVLWRSKDDKIVTVDDAGLVTAIADGETDVEAVSAEGLFVAKCAVVVKTVYVNRISFTETDVVFVLEDKYQLNPNIEPSDASDAAIGYTVKSGDAVTVDENGLVTAVKVGTATVRASALDGKGAYADVKFTVQAKPVVATSFSIECDTETQVGKTVTGTITWTPSDTNRMEIEVTSSNTGVATVQAGSAGTFTIKAVGAGETKITVKYLSNTSVPSQSFMFYVNAGAPSIAWNCDWTVSGIAIDKKGQGLLPGETFTLKATVTNLHDKSVKYESMLTGSDQGSATLNETSGVFKAQSRGWVYVRAVSVSNSSVATDWKGIYINYPAEQVVLATNYLSSSDYNAYRYCYSTTTSQLFVKRGTNVPVGFQVKDQSSHTSRGFVSIEISSNLKSYLSIDLTNNYNSDYSVARAVLKATSGTGTYAGTITVKVIGTSLTKQIAVIVCDYDKDDIKPGDSFILSDGSSDKTNTTYSIQDGGYRGGTYFFKGYDDIKTIADAVIVYVGTIGESDGRLRNMTFDRPSGIPSGVHGYAMALHNVSSSEGPVAFGGCGVNLSGYNEYLYGSGNYKGSGGIASTKQGKYGFEQTQGMLSYNYYHGSSYHYGAVHWLFDCDRSGSNGNYSAADVFNNKYWSGYPDLYRDGSTRFVYCSAWFIPTQAEWLLMVNGIGVSAFNDGMSRAGGTTINTTARYWTPTQYSANSFYTIRGNGSDPAGMTTDSQNYIRPFIAF